LPASELAALAAAPAPSSGGQQRWPAAVASSGGQQRRGGCQRPSAGREAVGRWAPQLRLAKLLRWSSQTRRTAEQRNTPNINFCQLCKGREQQRGLTRAPLHSTAIVSLFDEAVALQSCQCNGALGPALIVRVLPVGHTVGQATQTLGQTACAHSVIAEVGSALPVAPSAANSGLAWAHPCHRCPAPAATLPPRRPPAQACTIRAFMSVMQCIAQHWWQAKHCPTKHAHAHSHNVPV